MKWQQCEKAAVGIALLVLGAVCLLSDGIEGHHERRQAHDEYFKRTLDRPEPHENDHIRHNLISRRPHNSRTLRRHPKPSQKPVQDNTPEPLPEPVTTPTTTISGTSNETLSTITIPTTTENTTEALTTTENSTSITTELENAEPTFRGTFLDGEGDSGEATLTVPRKPKIVGTSDKEVSVSKGGNLTLTCNITGTPKPKAIWFHLDKELEIGNNLNITNEDDSNEYQLTIEPVECKNSGKYTCVSANFLGRVSEEFKVHVRNCFKQEESDVPERNVVERNVYQRNERRSARGIKRFYM